MPEVCRFYGISIRIFYDDHAPPHFHVEYGGCRASVDIQTGAVRGRLPARALRLVLEWYPSRRDALLEDWHLAAHRKPLKRIEPLE